MNEKDVSKTMLLSLISINKMLNKDQDFSVIVKHLISEKRFFDRIFELLL